MSSQLVNPKPTQPFIKPKNFRRLKKDDVYGVSSLAREIGRSPRTVERMLKAGLAHRRAGRRALIRGSDAIRFIEAASQLRLVDLQPGEHYCFTCRKGAAGLDDHIAREDLVASKHCHMKRIVHTARCPRCETYGFRAETIHHKPQV